MNGTFLGVAAVIGLLPAYVAHRKGYSFWLWWLFGFALFLLALPWSVIMKPNPATRRRCPLCRTTIDARARVCPQCGRDVFEYFASQEQR